MDGAFWIQCKLDVIQLEVTSFVVLGKWAKDFCFSLFLKMQLLSHVPEDGIMCIISIHLYKHSCHLRNAQCMLFCIADMPSPGRICV